MELSSLQCRKSSRLPTTEADFGYILLRAGGFMEVAIERASLAESTATAVVAAAAAAAVSSTERLRSEILKKECKDSWYLNGN